MTFLHPILYPFTSAKIGMQKSILWAPLKIKKFKAGETEKAQLSMGNKHVEVEVKHINSKFLEAPL
jgi:hypothetical protein